MNLAAKVRRETSTTKVELVETHNLTLSLVRLRELVPYDNDTWKRALVHACGMAKTGDIQIKKIREALDLP